MAIRLPATVPKGLHPTRLPPTRREPVQEGLAIFAPGWPANSLACWLARHSEAPAPVGFAPDRLPLPRSARLATILRDVAGWRPEARGAAPPWQVPGESLRISALQSTQHLDASLWIAWAMGASTAFLALPGTEASGPLGRWSEWQEAGGPLVMVTASVPASSPYPILILSPAGHWWVRLPPKSALVPLLLIALDLPGPPASFLEPGTPIWTVEASPSGYRVTVSDKTAQAVGRRWGQDVDMEQIMVDPKEVR